MMKIFRKTINKINSINRHKQDCQELLMLGSNHARMQIRSNNLKQNHKIFDPTMIL